MNDLASWWGWGSYDPGRDYSSRSQIAALELPIAEGSDPALLSPAYLLTREQIEATRTDAIVGGYFAVPRERLHPVQVAKIGEYWRRSDLVGQLGPRRCAKLCAVVSGLDWAPFGQLTPGRSSPGGRTRLHPPGPGAVVRSTAGGSPAVPSTPSGPSTTRTTRGRGTATARGVVRVTPTGTTDGRLFARPLPAPFASAPLPPPPGPPQGDGAEDAETIPPQVGPDESIASVSELEEFLTALGAMTPEGVALVLEQNPDLVSLLVDLGYIDREAIEAEQPTEIGASCCDDCARAEAYERAGAIRVGDFWSDLGRTVAQVDQQVIGPVWEGVKEYVPYGKQFDALHQARTGLLQQYAPEYYPSPTAGQGATRAPAASSKSPASSTRDAQIRDLQTLSRGVRRGDARSQATAIAMKERAAGGDPDARRRWAAYVAIALDDERRLEQGRA